MVSAVQIIAYEQIREDKYKDIKNAMFFVGNKSTVWSGVKYRTHIGESSIKHSLVELSTELSIVG